MYEALDLESVRSETCFGKPAVDPGSERDASPVPRDRIPESETRRKRDLRGEFRGKNDTLPSVGRRRALELLREAFAERNASLGVTATFDWLRAAMPRYMVLLLHTHTANGVLFRLQKSLSR